jgi:Ca2+-binding EF-hand superfamily protein
MCSHDFKISQVFALFDEDDKGKISFRNLKRIAQVAAPASGITCSKCDQLVG